jgi:hypothetical protein
MADVFKGKIKIQKLPQAQAPAKKSIGVPSPSDVLLNGYVKLCVIPFARTHTFSCGIPIATFFDN